MPRPRLPPRGHRNPLHRRSAETHFPDDSKGEKFSFDRLNIALTAIAFLVGTALTLAGLYVAERYGKSADESSKSGIAISAIDLLTDVETNKQCAGASILNYASETDAIRFPEELTGLAFRAFGAAFTSGFTLVPPSKPGVDLTGFPLDCNPGVVVAALSRAIATKIPRLFIVLPDESFTFTASTRQQIESTIRFAGQPLLIPSVSTETPTFPKADPPSASELLYFDSADGRDIGDLANSLSGAIQIEKISAHCSPHPERVDCKNPRLVHTFELRLGEDAKPLVEVRQQNSKANDPYKPRYILLPNYDFPGQKDFNQPIVTSRAECEKACDEAKEECKAYTYLPSGETPNNWHGPAGPYCWLKHEVWQPVPYAKLISAQKQTQSLTR